MHGTGCRYCEAGCPMHIQIPDLFAAFNAKKQGAENLAQNYQAITAGDHGKASSCIGCLQCESVCPQQLPVSSLLHKWRILWNRAHRRHVYNSSYIESGPVPKATSTHQRLLHQDFSYFLCGGLFSHTKVRNFPFPSNVTATEGDLHFPAKIPPLHFDAENAIMIKRLKF